MTQPRGSRAVVRVNDHCVGLGACVGVAPDLFRIVDDRAVPLGSPITGDQVALAEEAAERCPMQAIEIDLSEVAHRRNGQGRAG